MFFQRSPTPPPQKGSQPVNRPKAEPKRPGIFERSWWGQKLTMKEIAWHVDRMPGLQTWQREYVKRVMEKFDQPNFSRGITRAEFNEALTEMEKNTKDPIEKDHIKRIREYFDKL
jgi:hypothetical protein